MGNVVERYNICSNFGVVKTDSLAHEQPVFKKMGLFAGENCPVAERIARRGFYVPSGLALTDEQIEQVAISVREVFR